MWNQRHILGPRVPHSNGCPIYLKAQLNLICVLTCVEVDSGPESGGCEELQYLFTEHLSGGRYVTWPDEVTPCSMHGIHIQPDMIRHGNNLEQQILHKFVVESTQPKARLVFQVGAYPDNASSRSKVQ